MRAILRIINRFTKNEDGPTAVEYAALLGLITCICMAAIAILGKNSSSAYNKVGSSIGTAVSSGGSSGFAP